MFAIETLAGRRQETNNSSKMLHTKIVAARHASQLTVVLGSSERHFAIPL
jgi:hypothetical protein